MYFRFWCCQVVCGDLLLPFSLDHPILPSQYSITDVFSLGAGLLAGGNSSNSTLGQDVILAGLFIQIIAFGIFIYVAILFHRRMLAHPTYESTQQNMPWQRHLYVLYFVSLLIMIRSVVRVVEYIQGNAGYILSHEVFLYIFDGTLMFVAVAVFNIVHPSGLLPGRKGQNEEHVPMEPILIGSGGK